MNKSSATASEAIGQAGYIIPALVGAAVSGAAFALFLTFGPGRPTVIAPEPVERTNPPGNATALSESQRAAIEKTVEKYLLNNPQILMKMSESLERQQAEAQTAQVKKAIQENADLIYRDKYGLTAGNPQGDVTIVEFSDYNCPYCKRAFKDVSKLIESDSKVRLVMKEFPIFGERSEGAARVAITAEKQGKFFDLHTALLNNRGQNTEQSALALAEKLGLDMERLKKDMENEDAARIIKETRQLGNKLGIQGTPFYLVGDLVIPGAPDDLYDVFKKNVAQIREKGCETGC